jgi:hypothetical protein
MCRICKLSEQAEETGKNCMMCIMVKQQGCVVENQTSTKYFFSEIKTLSII